MIMYDLSYQEYEALDGMRPSTLKCGCKSMLHLKRAIAGGCQPDPKSVAVGSAVHCILAGELEERYSLIPDFDLMEENCTQTGKQTTSKNTNFYKDSVELWRLEHLGKEELNSAQVHTASLVANRVRTRFHKLLDASQQEVVVTGTIEGVDMKTRLDGLLARAKVVWDLKTTTDISDQTFFRIFDRLGYGFSASTHVELLRQNGIEIQDYLILAAEVQDDYDVRQLTIPTIAIENAWDKVKEVAGHYRKARDTDIWPGLPDKQMFISNWAMEQWEKDDDLD